MSCLLGGAACNRMRGLAKRSVVEGAPPPPEWLHQDGFTHLTADPGLLLGVANHFYTDSPHAEWQVLVLDAAKLRSKVRAGRAPRGACSWIVLRAQEPKRMHAGRV